MEDVPVLLQGGWRESDQRLPFPVPFCFPLTNKRGYPPKRTRPCSKHPCIRNMNHCHVRAWDAPKSRLSARPRLWMPSVRRTSTRKKTHQLAGSAQIQQRGSWLPRGAAPRAGVASRPASGKPNAGRLHIRASLKRVHYKCISLV